MDIKQWLGTDNELGITIWQNKYQHNNETFDEWLDRVTGGNEEYKQLIIEKKFLPAGRILSNRGLHKEGLKVTYSNCYVQTPPEDNIESIFDCAKGLARTFSYGGGVGIDISKLAPKGAKVNNTAKETSGAVSFMDLYSLVTGLIGQNGRRGALMISIDCDHPDLEEFIELKTDLDKVTKANISVKITKEFMDAVKNNTDYTLSFTRTETGETTEKVVKAKEVFKKLCLANWDFAEPGMLFWDEITYWNLLSNNDEFEYAGVNPCAEEPLPAGGSCLLGSINLAEFVKEDKTFEFVEFIKTTKTAVRFLNEILDEGLALHPLDIQQETVRDWRQIGLGIMGLADMLIKMEIPYGSKESIEICDSIGYKMIQFALESSAELAKEYGTYPKYNNKVLATEFLKYNMTYTESTIINKYGLRNSQLLTCAPTGTLSTMLGISGGIEPIFANYYTRKTESLHGEDVFYKVYTPIVDKYMKEHGITDDADLPPWFVTSGDINYEDRIAMQSVWQSHIDASISSTINLPQEATVEDVENIYILAHEKHLKGVTIYRSGCKREGILVTEDQSVDEDMNVEISPEICSFSNEIEVLPRGYILEADDDAIGKKRKLITGCGSLHCSAFFDPVTGDLLETYLSKGSSGGCNNFMIGLSRMISLAARGGVPIESIIDQLNSCGTCPSYAVRRATNGDTSKGSCCPIAIGNALKDMYDEMQSELCSNDFEDSTVYEMLEKLASDSEYVVSTTSVPCPQCGEPLVFEGGCNSCKACGHSDCD